MTGKLLILDDDLDILNMLELLLASDDLQVHTESESGAALKYVLAERPNVAIFDINMPGRSGLEVLREAKQIDPGLAVVMTTAYKTTQNAIEAMKCGAYDYMTKPFDIKRLKATVLKALESNMLNRKVR